MKKTNPKTFLCISMVLSLFLGACQEKTPVPPPEEQIRVTATEALNEIPPATLTVLPTSTTPTPIFTKTPTPAVGADLKKLADFLPKNVDWYLDIYELGDDSMRLAIQENEQILVASMVKLPLAMAVLSIMDEDGIPLEQVFDEEVDERSFDDLLSAMIVQSDEEASYMLEQYASWGSRLFQRMDEWGFTDIDFIERSCSVKTLAGALEALWNGQYLTADARDYLLGLMGVQSKDDRLHLGVLTQALPGSHFLNKRGSFQDPAVAGDCGLLIYEDQVYVLVVVAHSLADSAPNYTVLAQELHFFGLALAELIANND